jgi:hypothetical protein
MINLYSPVAFFVYKRPAHTIRVLEKLANNMLANQSDLIVFSDAAKEKEDRDAVDEVRKIVKKAKGFKSVEVIERSQNKGLADSIIDGVSEIMNKHKKIIVLEDDLLTSPFFLKYMNAALDLYEEETEVISIHGYLYPLQGMVPNTFFIKGADCWGWGTWQRGWNLFERDSSKLLTEIKKRNLIHDFDMDGWVNNVRMLKKQNKGKINSWAIRWHASAYLQNKLTLYPGKSLIKNIGFDISATHTTDNNYFGVNLSFEPINIQKIPPLENLEMKTAIIEFYKKNKSNLLKKAWQLLKRF